MPIRSASGGGIKDAGPGRGSCRVKVIGGINCRVGIGRSGRARTQTGTEHHPLARNTQLQMRR